MSATCSSCSKPVIWTKTKRGSSMPVDPDPVATGNLRLVQMQRFVLAEVVPKDERSAALFSDGQPLYVSHFVTCPNAE